MADDAYETDFVAWADEQAAVLRARGAGGNALDYDHLAEEIEGVGQAERNSCKSYVRRIIEHLFKLETSASTDPRKHWTIEILQFRADFDNHVTATIRRELPDQLDRAHRQAARLAQASLDLHEPGLKVDAERRWTLEQILGEADDPVALPPTTA